MPDRVGLDLATLLVTTLLSNYNQSALIYNGHNFSSGECLYFEENQGMWACEVTICNCNYKIISTFESWITVMV